MNSDELIASYEAKGRRSGAIFLLDPGTAIDFIIEAKASRIAVYGLDGFLVRDRGIQPLQECELDVEQAEDPHDAALAYLAEFASGGGLMFEVAIE